LARTNFYHNKYNIEDILSKEALIGVNIQKGTAVSSLSIGLLTFLGPIKSLLIENTNTIDILFSLSK
jgi:hypothetical protein